MPKQTLTQTRTRARARAALLTSVFLNFAFRLFMFGPVHAVLHAVKTVKTKDFTVQPRRHSLSFQCNWTDLMDQMRCEVVWGI